MRRAVMCLTLARVHDEFVPYQLVKPASPDAEGLFSNDPGRYCVTVWASDEDDQVGPAASAWVDVPAT